MAYPEVNEETVYLTAGAPLPSKMDHLLTILLNDSFKESYNNVYQVKILIPIIISKC